MEPRRIAVCVERLGALRHPDTVRRLRVAVPSLHQWTSRSMNTHAAGRPQTAIQPAVKARFETRRYAQAARPASHTQSASSSDLNAIHIRIHDLSATVLKPTDGKLPLEQRILYVLENLEAIAKSMVDAKSIAGAKSMTRSREETATSALLGSVNHKQQPSSVSKASLLSSISQKAEEIMRHPNVFLTPAVLRSYVDLQTLLHQPSSFPDIFSLYAQKAIPKQTSFGNIEYTAPQPAKISAAIDSATADAALQTAIQAHNLPLAIDILNTSFCTTAYKKSKVLRQALVPIVGLGLAPIAAYTLASQFSSLQSTMSAAHAQTIAFAGICTYFGAVGTVGYVAVTTANDQMERVTWAMGVPLWERWVREEERAAIDKVAVAWGFKEVGRRGEEEGAEWEDLREFVGVRGMVLDKVSLMEGME